MPALLDKDTLYGGFVAATLAAAGRAPDEREGDWYDEHIKRYEYAGMTAAAREISARGCPVLLERTVHPADPRSRRAGISGYVELGGGPVELVYVRSDAATLASRLAARASSRDGGKRAEFAAFLARMTPDVSPPVPHHEIDNRRGAPDLAAQIRPPARTRSRELGIDAKQSLNARPVLRPAEGLDGLGRLGLVRWARAGRCRRRAGR